VRGGLLLTDGVANNGLTEPVALAAFAKDLRASGVTTSTFGDVDGQARRYPPEPSQSGKDE